MNEANKTEKKIAIIGDFASVIGFRGVGFKVFALSDLNEAAPRLTELIKSQQYAIIYMTVSVAERCTEIIEQQKTSVYPALIRLPLGRSLSVQKEEEDDLAFLRNSVKRAIGFDVLEHQEMEEGEDSHV